MAVLKKFSILFLLITLISSCNIENGFIQKRKYQKGYYIALNQNKSVVKNVQPEAINIDKSKVLVTKETNTDNDDGVVEEVSSPDNEKAIIADKTHFHSSTKVSQLKESKLIKHIITPFAPVRKFVDKFSIQKNQPTNISSTTMFNSTGLTIGVLVALMVGLVLALRFLEGTTAWLVALGIVIALIIIFAT